MPTPHDYSTLPRARRGWLLSTAAVVASSALLLASCADNGSEPVTSSPSLNEQPSSSAAPQPAQAQPWQPGELRQFADQRAEVLETLPFDSQSFTQGLDMDGENLLVGTGLEGKSRIYRRTIAGDELASQPLDDQYFGEGVAVAGDSIYQLTWRNGTVFVRDRETLDVKSTATISGEGWGVCATPSSNTLWTSDGSSELSVIDPAQFTVQSTLPVTYNGRPVLKLNELDCTGEHIFANVWLEPLIVEIDPKTGEVVHIIDVSDLYPDLTDHNAVANGIARIPGTDEFYVTGKLWDKLYRVNFVNK